MKLEQLFPVASTLDIVDGSGNPTDIKFKVVGKDSKAYRDAQNKAMKLMMGKKDANQDPEFIIKSNAELMASCVVGWEGLEDTPYSPAKAVELLSMPELSFILEQVENFVFERANFFYKGSSTAGPVRKTAGKAKHTE